MAQRTQIAVAAQLNKTVSTVALSLTDLGFSAAEVDAADRALISIETNSIRYTVHGTAPTSANGHLVTAGTTFTVEGHELLSNLKLIRASADAVAQITLTKW